MRFLFTLEEDMFLVKIFFQELLLHMVKYCEGGFYNKMWLRASVEDSSSVAGVYHIWNQQT